MDHQTSQRVFGLTSHLLQYPDFEWRENLPIIREELASLPDESVRRMLEAFLDEAEPVDELDWQDRYVQTFDFGKKSNLYLTYSQHGEERERGTALLELKRRYAEAGFELVGTELPDYLPLMLEFASAASWDAAEGVLNGRSRALGSIHGQLAESGSPYAGLLDLLQQIVAGFEQARAAELEAAQAGRGEE